MSSSLQVPVKPAAEPRAPAVFSIRPDVVARCLAAIIALLVLAGVAASVIVWTGHDYAYGFVPSFRLDREANVPTFFAAAQLAAAALLLLAIARAERWRAAGAARPWLVLALGFALMSLDEIAGLHERLIEPLRLALGIAGPSPLHFAWVVAGVALVALLGCYFVPFLLRLPVATRRRFLLAAGVFLAGAIGMEMIGGYVMSLLPEAARLGTDAAFAYEMVASVEEALEMIGVAIFIRALLAHCAGRVEAVTIRFSGTGPDPAGDASRASANRV